VIEERQGREAAYRLELIKCNRDHCQKCRNAPAHGPFWYAYGDGVVGTAIRYVGKPLPHEMLDDSQGRADEN
jgi:hypothetical protein